MKELRDKIEKLRLKRLTEQEEKRRRESPLSFSHLVAAPSPKPLMVVAPKLVPPIKFRLPPM